MVKMKAVYQGQKHCELTHEPSQSVIETDAPRDNQGKGESFSPTDLVGAALLSCILTTMAIVSDREGIAFSNASGTVEKEMLNTPRKIGTLNIHIQLPATLSPEHRTKLEDTARNCPVARSLSSEMKLPMTFTYV